MPLATLTVIAIASHSWTSQPQQGLSAYEETIPKSVVKFKMVPVQQGTVTIKDKAVEVKPFYIATTETVWEAYDEFLRSGPPSPSYDQTEFVPDAVARPSKSYILPDLGWGHAGFPVINVSSTSVTMFCRWLAKETGKKYRLPTEAEWQLACTTGLTKPWPWTPADLDKAAWFKTNSLDMTHPVAKKLPDKLGLYDMLGNVGEWATDMAGKPVLCGGSFNDGPGLQAPTTRRYHDPSWQATDPQIPKSRWWLADGPFCGFRLVCEP